MDTERVIKMGVQLRPEVPFDMPDFHHELIRVVGGSVRFRIATETSPGEPFDVHLRDYLDPDALLRPVCEAFDLI